MTIEIIKGEKPKESGAYIVRYACPSGGYGWGDDIFDGKEWLFHKNRVTHYAIRPVIND